jgi:hypothetical protein
MMRARERAPTPFLSAIFCLGLTFGSLKELGARQYLLQQTKRKIIMFKDGNGSIGGLEERKNNGHEEVTTY